jgi:hypothetical protein
MRASFLSLDTLVCLVGLAQTMSFSFHPILLVSPRTRLPTSLLASRRFNDAREDNDFDIDQVRQRLEALVVGSSDSLTQQEAPKANVKSMLREKPVLQEYSIDIDLDLPTQPPLTSIDRERRMVEIQLLANLESGDQALSDLWTHWIQERGAAAAARLLRAEELTSQGPKYWAEAERMLKDLIEEYGIYWAEPVNRLATLFYMQGKLRDSETLSKLVLKVKPWHFGALSGIVMVYAGLRDSESARMWAARRMPSFAPEGSNRRRAVWVERAFREAEKSLDDAEMRLKKSFGEPDQHQSPDQEVVSDDAWQ